MRTIPNGIDLVDAAALAGPAEGAIMRQRHGIGAGETVLLSVGRLGVQQGVRRAGRRARRARATGRPALGRPAGAGSSSAPVRTARTSSRRSTAHGLGSHVVFAGRAPDADLHAWYEAASVFVHPTRYEGSSLVTLEAMAHRRPVIATRAGGLPDKVRPGVNGWLVEPGDVGALAAAISESGVTAELGPLGAASRDIVEREFAWTRLVDRHIELYEELWRLFPGRLARRRRSLIQ